MTIKIIFRARILITDILEDRTASIFRVEAYSESAHALAQLCVHSQKTKRQLFLDNTQFFLLQL